MIIKFILFLVMVLGFFLGAHYLLFFSLVKFFTIDNLTFRTGLLSVIFFLSISFFIAALLIHLHTNVIFTWFYIFSAFWLGLFIYLLLALAVIWLFFGLGRLIGHVPDMAAVSLIIYIAAAGVSVYGVWNAFHPRLKHIEVSMADLPEHWQGRTIVHLSDIHLGAVHRAAFMRRVAGQVNSVNPDLVLITGDLFDGMGGRFDDYIEPLKSLRAEKGVFFCLGNHEGYLGLTGPLAVLKQTGITVLDDMTADIDGLQVVGISFPEFDKTPDIEGVFTAEKGYDAAKPSILLFHTPSNIQHSNNNRGQQQTSTYWFPDIDLSFARDKGIDLQLSGHTHRGQFFPFNLLTRMIYKGNYYGLRRDGAITLYTTSGVGTWGPPLRVGAPPEIVVIKLK